MLYWYNKMLYQEKELNRKGAQHCGGARITTATGGGDKTRAGNFYLFIIMNDVDDAELCGIEET
jgi:hypothetical protein